MEFIPFQQQDLFPTRVHIAQEFLEEKEFQKMKLATPVSEGWLFSKDKETVKIFAGYDVDEEGITFSERSVFPTSCVKKLTYLD